MDVVHIIYGQTVYHIEINMSLTTYSAMSSLSWLIRTRNYYLFIFLISSVNVDRSVLSFTILFSWVCEGFFVLPTRVECLHNILLSGWPTCVHSNLSWVADLFTCQRPPLTSYWLWGHLSGAPPILWCDSKCNASFGISYTMG